MEICTMVAFDYQFNGETEKREDRYSLTYKPITRPLLGSWKEEVEHEAIRLANTVKRPFVVCMSGGIDSEIIARAFHDIGAPMSVLTIRYKDGSNEHDIIYAKNFCQSRGIQQGFIDIDPIPFYETMMKKYIDMGYVSDSVYRYVILMLMEHIEWLGKCAIMGGGLQQYRIVNRKLCIKHHHSLLSTLDWMKNNNAEHYPLFFSNTPEIFAVYQEEPLIRFMIQNQEYFRTYMGADNSPEKILVAHKLWAGMTPRPKFNGYEQIYDWKMIKQAELVTRFPHMTYIIKPIWQIRQELGLEKIC